MEFNSTRVSVRYLSLLLCFISWQGLHSQTHKPIQTTIHSFCGGYYEYLPINYSTSGTKTYPLIIFLHGRGNSGNGKLPELNSVLGAGVPRVIDQNQFPQSFTVNGNDVSFIVISPQFSRWPVVHDIQGILNYVLPRYKVDVSRIYITGLSMGGGATWDYAQSSIATANGIAAIVPVCGDSDPATGTPQVIAQANLPVWATHNSGDPDVGVSKTNGFITAINGTVPAPNPLAKKNHF